MHQRSDVVDVIWWRGELCQLFRTLQQWIQQYLCWRVSLLCWVGSSITNTRWPVRSCTIENVIQECASSLKSSFWEKLNYLQAVHFVQVIRISNETYVEFLLRSVGINKLLDLLSKNNSAESCSSGKAKQKLTGDSMHLIWQWIMLVFVVETWATGCCKSDCQSVCKILHRIADWIAHLHGMLIRMLS